MSAKKYKHPMIFRCGCKKEHRPKPGTWAEQSAEIGALGWRLIYKDEPRSPGYVLRCGECVEAAA